jgi:hypothetical protein
LAGIISSGFGFSTDEALATLPESAKQLPSSYPFEDNPSEDDEQCENRK